MTRLAAVIIVVLGLGAVLRAQECWDVPAKVTGVVLDENDVPVEGADVVLRSFLRPLVGNARRHSVFDPPLAVTSADAQGRFSLTLREWTTVLYGSVVVVASAPDKPRVEFAEVRPEYRRSHQLTLRLPAAERESRPAPPARKRFVGADGAPLACVEVACLVPVSNDEWVVGLSTRTGRGPRGRLAADREARG